MAAERLARWCSGRCGRLVAAVLAGAVVLGIVLATWWYAQVNQHRSFMVRYETLANDRGRLIEDHFADEIRWVNELRASMLVAEGRTRRAERNLVDAFVKSLATEPSRRVLLLRRGEITGDRARWYVADAVGDVGSFSVGDEFAIPETVRGEFERLATAGASDLARVLGYGPSLVEDGSRDVYIGFRVPGGADERLMVIVSTLEVLRRAILPSAPIGLITTLDDVTDPGSPIHVHRWVPRIGGNTPGRARCLLGHPGAIQRVITFANRRWVATFVPNDHFMSEQHGTVYWWVLPLGVLLAALAAFVTHRLMGDAERLQRLVEDRTREIREREAEFRHVFEESTDGMVMVSPERRFVRVNRAFASMMGMTPQELVGRSVADFIEPENVRQDPPLSTFGATDGVVMKRRVWVRADGSRVVTELHGHVFADGHAIGSVRDISEKLRMEEQERAVAEKVQQAQKMQSLGMMAGGIAHDFNNQLMVVVGNAELLRPPGGGDSRVKRCLAAIENATQRMAGLCRQMLAYAGEGHYTLRGIDLRETWENVAPMMDVARARGVTIDVDLPEDLSPVFSDPRQMEQVVSNLVVNAIESFEGGKSGQVSVRMFDRQCSGAALSGFMGADLLPDGRYVVLEVTDNGAGMDRETLGRIFDPFFTTKFQGRGLGLPAVLGIVRVGGGGVSVESLPGGGTTVTVVMPARGDVVKRARVVEATTEWRGRGRVLVIDDEAAVRTVAREMLGVLGLQTIEAEDGVSGLATFAREKDRVDAVLLDIQMPGMDGLSVLRRIREMSLTTRVILFTGYRDDDSWSNSGVKPDAFLQKPFSLNSLRETMRKMLGEKRFSDSPETRSGSLPDSRAGQRARAAANSGVLT